MSQATLPIPGIVAAVEPLTIVVAGEPCGQPRARSCVIYRFSGKKGRKVPSTRQYEDDESDGYAWKQKIIRAARKLAPNPPLDGPLRVDVFAYFARTKELLKPKYPRGPIWMPQKPDRDNMDKCVLDALTEARVWLDDKQVCAGEPLKWYVSIDCQPGIVIKIRPLTETAEEYERLLDARANAIAGGES